MILEIVTPEATLLHSEVELVSVPGVNGEFQMLNSGTIEMKANKVIVLAD